MLSNVKRSEAIVRDLLSSEIDDFYSTALSGLLGSLSVQADLLEQKIQQLNDDNLTDSTPPPRPRPRPPPPTPSTPPGGRKPWRRILLYGPPGTGKSRLAQAASAEVNATFYCVSSADLVSSYIGESEKLIKELFCHARSQEGQSIIFIDEIDSLCRLRNSREDDSTRRIKTELLIQMEATDKYDKANIFLLCATNCPWELDKAFLRRFQKRIYTPLPDKGCRIEMMKLHCRENTVNLKDSDWQRLGEETQGYSGSDLSVLTNAALFQPIRDLQSASYWRKTTDGKWSPVDTKNKFLGIKANLSDIPPKMVCPRYVTLEDFLSALKLHTATVSVEELERFAGFTNCYGQCG